MMNLPHILGREQMPASPYLCYASPAKSPTILLNVVLQNTKSMVYAKEVFLCLHRPHFIWLLPLPTLTPRANFM
jgi:hypothetical protein